MRARVSDAVAVRDVSAHPGSQPHYTTDDLPMMVAVFTDLWPVLKEKLRCKGVDVSGMQPPRAVGGADPQQSRLERFFAGPQGE